MGEQGTRMRVREGWEGERQLRKGKGVRAGMELGMVTVTVG